MNLYTTFCQLSHSLLAFNHPEMTFVHSPVAFFCFILVVKRENRALQEYASLGKLFPVGILVPSHALKKSRLLVRK